MSLPTKPCDVCGRPTTSSVGVCTALLCRPEYSRRRYAKDPKKHLKATNKWRSEHRAEVNAKASVRRSQRTPEFRVAEHLKYVYGITIDDYYGLLEKQNDRCAICGSECVTGQRLSVDHDHATGKVRGLLCRKCNSALGHFDDRLDLVKKAVEYLERPI